MIWNVGRVANKGTMHHLKHLVKCYKMPLIALLEPMIPISRALALEEPWVYPKSLPMRIMVVKFGFVLRMIYTYMLFYLQNIISLSLLIEMVLLLLFLLFMLNVISSLGNIYGILFLI